MIIIEGRVPCHAKVIRRFVKWMNKSYPMRRKVVIHIHKDAELAHKEKNEFTLYGLYTNQHIRVALGALDETMSLIVIGHELGHAQQDFTKMPLSEPYADHFAVGCVLLFRGSEKK